MLKAHEQPTPFTFRVIKPYSTDASHASVPFLIEGLFKQGGLSSLVAKPKQGKSSLARYAAVCVSKGEPFLGRKTIQGEVLLISIEDRIDHVNTCLKVLEYDQSADSMDARIHLVDRVAPTLGENIAALRTTLTDFPNIRLVVIDTLAKFVHVKDINDYNQWLPVFNQIRQLGRDFPLISILCLIHAKKVTAEDPFDSMLGSSALRGEFDTNAAIYKEANRADRLFTTESRIGKAVQPVNLRAELEEADGSDVVRNFCLGQTLSQLETDKQQSSAKRRKQAIEERIEAYLWNCPTESCLYGDLINNVEGRAEDVLEGLNALIASGAIITSGTKSSKSDPYSLRFNRPGWDLHKVTTRLSGTVQ